MIFQIAFSISTMILFAMALSRIFVLDFSISLVISNCFLPLLLFYFGISGFLAFFLDPAFKIVLLVVSVLIIFTKTSVNNLRKRFIEPLIFLSLFSLVTTLVYFQSFGTKPQTRIWNSDDWGYWASMSREIVSNQQLPDGESGNFFRMYQPGVPIYNAFFANQGFSSSEVLIGTQFFVFSIIFALSKILRIKATFQVAYGLVVAFAITLSFGYGYWSASGDQFLITLTSLILVYIFFEPRSATKNYVIIVLSAFLTLIKQPGIILALFLLSIALINGDFRDTARVGRKSGKFSWLPTKSFPLGCIAAYVTYEVWNNWVLKNSMSGLFLGNTNNRINLLLEGNPVENFFSYLVKIMGPFLELILKLSELKFGFPLFYLDTADAPSLLIIVTFSLFMFLSSLFMQRSKNLIPLAMKTFSLVSITVFIWLLGLSALQVDSFDQTSEGRFPSVSRYLGYVIIPIIVLNFSHFTKIVSSKIENKEISTQLGIIFFGITIVLLPKPSFEYFPITTSEANINKEINSYFERPSALKLMGKLDKYDKVCSVEKGNYLLGIGFNLYASPTYLGYRVNYDDFAYDQLVSNGCDVVLFLCDQQECEFTLPVKVADKTLWIYKNLGILKL